MAWSHIVVVDYSTDIFIPENGSKNNSEKIIIVLSDGEILGDNMTLADVLNKPQMKGVTRYSIGVSVPFTANLRGISDNPAWSHRNVLVKNSYKYHFSDMKMYNFKKEACPQTQTVIGNEIFVIIYKNKITQIQITATTS